MGSSTLLIRLRSKKATVNQDISDSKNKIAALEDKISRLSEAEKSLSSSISDLKAIQSDIDDFEVSKSKWQGETERDFIGKYNSYAIFLKKYKSDTEEAKEQIEEALENAKEEKSNTSIGLSNLEGILVGLETDIASAKENV